MKKLLCLLLFFTFFSTSFLKAYNRNLLLEDSLTRNIKNYTVYWFYIKVKVEPLNKENKLSVKAPVLSGSLEDFDKTLWRKLQGGRILVIGPFFSQDEAVISHKIYYSVAKNKNFDAPQNMEKLYWLKLKFTTSKRTRSFIFKHEYNIFSGTCRDFYEDVKLGLKEKDFLIGPFKNIEHVKEMIPKKTNCDM